MMRVTQLFKPAVAAALLAVTSPMTMTPAWADDPAALSDTVRDLLAELATAEDAATADRLEDQIVDAWSKSGSPAMNVLLRRGRAALEVRDWALAIRHFRALTDHAPDFAEGWHGLALAYYNADRLGPAMDALERTLTLNPYHFGALRGVAAVHEQIDNPTLAYDAYARVLAMRPHAPDIVAAMERLEPAVTGTAL